MSRLLVLAAGNEMRGDDAAGPQLAAFVEGLALSGVRVLCEYQFQVEHAVDLAEADLALFIDAHARQARPLVFTTLTAPEQPRAGSHALEPAEVMGVAHRLGLTVPPTFVMSVAGQDFELGASMSEMAVAGCARAQALLERLLAAPSLDTWCAAAASGASHGD